MCQRVSLAKLQASRNAYEASYVIVCYINGSRKKKHILLTCNVIIVLCTILLNSAKCWNNIVVGVSGQHDIIPYSNKA